MKRKKKQTIDNNSNLNSYQNNLDKEFNNLINFIKNKTVEEIIESIKHNFNYHKQNDPANYYSIANYYNKYNLWGSINLENNDYQVIENNANCLVNHLEDFKWLYNNLCDYRSKKILIRILSYWLMLDYPRVKEIKDNNFSQYFDLDLIKCDENEVLVDIGCYIGDTVISYINTFGKDCYKSIYCYDIVPSNIEYVKKNIDNFDLKNVIVRLKGAASKNETLYLQKDEASSIAQLQNEGDIIIETVRVDDDIQEPITFIKMDIEGAEEDALLGCKNKIIENHPKLAISAYHNNDHLWKIAKIIYELDPTYKFYLRYYGGDLMPTEYILYAI